MRELREQHESTREPTVQHRVGFVTLRMTVSRSCFRVRDSCLIGARISVTVQMRHHPPIIDGEGR